MEYWWKFSSGNYFLNLWTTVERAKLAILANLEGTCFISSPFFIGKVFVFEKRMSFFYCFFHKILPCHHYFSWVRCLFPSATNVSLASQLLHNLAFAEEYFFTFSQIFIQFEKGFHTIVFMRIKNILNFRKGFE